MISIMIISALFIVFGFICLLSGGGTLIVLLPLGIGFLMLTICYSVDHLTSEIRKVIPKLEELRQAQLLNKSPQVPSLPDNEHFRDD